MLVQLNLVHYFLQKKENFYFVEVQPAEKNLTKRKTSAQKILKEKYSGARSRGHCLDG